MSDDTIGRRRAYDAIVVGARPAGASTAMLLARAGRSVLLLDRGQYGSDTLSTHALMRGGVIQLHRWGLLDAVRGARTPSIRRAVFHYGDETVELALRDRHGTDALYAARRTVLDRILVDTARAAGAEVVWGAHVRSVERDRDGRVCGVKAQVGSSAWASAEAPIVIGADGLNSRVADAVQAPVEHTTPSGSAFVYGYFHGLASDRYDWYYRPGLSAGTVPTNDGLANVFVGLPNDRFAEERWQGNEGLFTSVLREVAPELAADLARSAPSAPFRSFSGRGGYLRRAHGPGWALVGDAGYFKDPMTSHGITDALRDGELLARALLDRPAEDPDASAYQAIRDDLAVPFLRASEAAASYSWTLDQLRGIHRQMKALTDPEIELIAGLSDPQAVLAA